MFAGTPFAGAPLASLPTITAPIGHATGLPGTVTVATPIITS